MPSPQQSLHAYLRSLRSAALELSRHGPATGTALRRLGEWPPVGRPRVAAGVLDARRAYRVFAALLRSTVPPPAVAAAHAMLIRSAELTAGGLGTAGRALRSGGSARARMAVRRAGPLLDRAAHLALRWRGAVSSELRRLGMAEPSWPAAHAALSAGLLHALQAGGHAMMEPGMTGVSVRLLQRRMADLGYLSADLITGQYDYRTLQAVIAFQGWEGLVRDGIAGPETLAEIDRAVAPVPWSAAGRHIEVHLDRQVLLLVEPGRPVRAIHVSTGAPGRDTPSGSFAVYRKERMSWSRPFQVWMPYANYFSSGYAMHEYPDVPVYPASHGCIRIPAGDSLVVWSFAALGTPVVIGSG